MNWTEVNLRRLIVDGRVKREKVDDYREFIHKN